MHFNCFYQLVSFILSASDAFQKQEVVHQGINPLYYKAISIDIVPPGATLKISP